MHAVVRELGAICGADFVRPAGAADAVAGVPARVVAAPGTIADLVAAVQVARARDLRVAARGAATKLDWGAPPAGVDLIIDTGRLGGVWHHCRARRFVEVGAGTPVRLLQRRLAPLGQRLALDPPAAGATVGGALAAGEVGPLAHRFGAPAQQLLACSYLGADGALHHLETAAGPPAAADAPGPPAEWAARGAVMVSATLPVTAVPPARAWVHRSVWTPAEARDAAAAVSAAGPAPAAVEVDLPAAPPALLPRRRGRVGPGTLAVLLEGRAGPVRAQAAAVCAALRGGAALSAEPPAWWGRYPFGPDEVALRLTVPPAHVAAAVYALRDVAGAGVPVRGGAGLGVLHAALPGRWPPERVAAVLAGVRAVLAGRAGSCTVLAAPPPLRGLADLWRDAARP